MNEATQIELKKIVERAVRPVRAGIERKRRMRDDLLSHVVAVYEEELGRSNNEAASLAATIKRFGDPAPLTAELQASVSFVDRLPFVIGTRVFDFRPGETIRRRAFRLTMMGLAFTTVVSILALGAFFPLLMILGKPMHWSEAFRFLLVVYGPSQCVVTFLFVPILDLLRKAMSEPKSRNRFAAAVVLVASSGIIPIVSFFDYWALSQEFGIALRLTMRLLPMSALTPFGLYFLAWATAREIAYRNEWQALEIE